MMIIVEAGVLPRIRQFNMGNSGSKLWAIMACLAGLLALSIACNSEGLTSTDIQSPRSADEIKKAAEALWDDWFYATQAHDASAFYSLLARNVTDRCTLEQMEQFFEMDDDAFTYPEMDVKEVFVAPGNSENAFMTMELLSEPGAGEQGIRDAYVANIPYPIVRENGRWLMYLQFPIVEHGCPFVGEISRQEAIPAEGPTSTSP